MTTNPKRNIPTLDGWRALAILLVTFCHAAMSIWSDDPKIVAMTQFGALGVDVFFALSGLLITKLLLEEHKRTGGINLKAFYIRRCFRVLIPCYCYVAFVFLFSLYRNRLELLSSVLFFRNYLSAAYEGPYTRHLWSLFLAWRRLQILIAQIQPLRRVPAQIRRRFFLHELTLIPELRCELQHPANFVLLRRFEYRLPPGTGVAAASALQLHGCSRFFLPHPGQSSAQAGTRRRAQSMVPDRKTPKPFALPAQAEQSCPP